MWVMSNRLFCISALLHKTFLNCFMLVHLILASICILANLMMLFYQVNILAVSKNLWLLLSSKIWLFLNLVKHTSENYSIIGIPHIHSFFSSFSHCWVISNFVIFHKIKAVKHIWESIWAETGSWFIIIRISQLPVSATRWQHRSHMFCNFYLAKNHKIANNSTSTEAEKKISADLKSIKS